MKPELSKLSDMKYRFERIKTVEDVLKAIGREDISSVDVSISVPAIDPATGEVVADWEIDFGEHILTTTDERRLADLMRALGYVLKEKV